MHHNATRLPVLAFVTISLAAMLAATCAMTTQKLKQSAQANRTTSYAMMKKSPLVDHQAESSLLRPSILRGLLGAASAVRRRPFRPEMESESSGGDEEQEVTKTIMVPMGPGGEVADDEGQAEQPEEAAAGASPSAHEGPMRAVNHQHMLQYVSGRPVAAEMKTAGSQRYQANRVGRGQQASREMMAATQPSVGASLQLTSTEIGGLLNDREAPEFYRERELNGDGVEVGEEQRPLSGAHQSTGSTSGRLGMAASGHFGGAAGAMGPYGGMGGYAAGGGGDAADEALARYRLNQAASEEGGGGGVGGFNHRFGQYGAGGVEGGELAGGVYGGGGGGGLMQAPNEYNEVSNMAGGYMPEGAAHAGAYGAGDYSGLMRGASGEFGAGGGGPLDTAAAAAGAYGGDYSQAAMGGGGGGEYSPSSFYGGAGGEAAVGRLQAHASFNPYMGGAGGEAADYSSRFGQSQYDQRGFASQNNHQIAQSSGGSSGGGRLMPFSPVVPLNDESSASVTQPSVHVMPDSSERLITPSRPIHHARHETQGAAAAATAVHHDQQQAQMFVPRTRSSGLGNGTPAPQVHEALEEDPTDVTEAEVSQSQQQQQQHPNYSSDETSGRNHHQQQQIGGNEMGASLVLNVPPPTHEQSRRQPPTTRGSAQQMARMVEFSRIGSAGYLGPRAPGALAKKVGYQFGNRSNNNNNNQIDNDNGDEHDTQPTGSGSENPAHAGKYIIDRK